LPRQALRIATRRSQLARWQTDHVAGRLRALHPGLEIEIVEVVTTGDRVRDRKLSLIGEHGVFTKELEQALLAGKADLAVHSLKDLETTLPGGLELLGLLERADPRDALVSRSGARLAELPAGARIGTSSIRRRAQLLALRRDLTFEDLRGNVPTRVAKLAEGRGDLDAIVLALAGLERLGLRHRVAEVFAPDRCLPAVGQGALAVEGRSADMKARDLVAPLDHLPTRQAVLAERAFLRRLHGGCQVPAGALGQVAGGTLTIDAVVCAPGGETLFRDRVAGPAVEGEAIGGRLAESLLARGADRVLAEITARHQATAERGPR
jgi:hydroxymethylbilane synthase